tara:strand:+ start:1523 stop:2728 length:1206 start_codon:yes stop_codon:yes gene_type:complete
MAKSNTLLIVGGGIVGMTLAREAALRNDFSKITLIEKEEQLGFHASSRNSGVIHAGFYYAPNSKKALFCSEANTLLRDYCLTNKVELIKTGKVVVCKDEKELEILYELYERGVANKSKIYFLDEKELKHYESLAITNSKFIWSPNTWSANPKDLIKKLNFELKELGVNIILNRKIVAFENNIIIDNKNYKYEYDFLINAAGAYSLKLAKMMGINTNYVLLPFRGMYLKSNQKVRNFNAHIYPVPNIKQPFLGIHTTLTSDGYLKLGPTAFPVFSPENYRFFEGIDLDFLPSIVFNQLKLFINNSFGYRNLAFQEFNNLFKDNILSAAQKLTKYKLNSKDFSWYTPGIRAQLFDNKNEILEMDFVNVKNSNQYHILNSISPAWTCSFKTAKYVIDEIEKIIK